MTFSLDYGPAGMALTGSGLLSWTASLADLGPQFLGLTLEDSTGMRISYEFVIEVVDAPPPGGPDPAVLEAELLALINAARATGWSCSAA